MRSYYNSDKFFQKMKKKPELQRVIDSISEYTDEMIDQLSGPHFPLWIKEELKKLNKRSGKTSEEIAQEIANKMIQASQKN